jgi:hypothetical protein
LIRNVLRSKIAHPHQNRMASAEPNVVPRTSHISFGIGRHCHNANASASVAVSAIKGVEQFAYLLGGTPGHDDDLSNPATANQFGKQRIDAKCPGDSPRFSKPV